MSFKITGTVHSIGEVQQVSEKFAKRDIIIEDSSGKYPQHIPFQFTQDKVNDLNNFAPGQEVEISFNLKGRIWNNPKTGLDQCFGTNEGWKIEAIGSAPVAPQVIAQSTDNEVDDLPF